MSHGMSTACIIIIGNEILSGRTKDKNLPWLAEELNKLGVRVMEARVVPDIEQEIVDAINTLRAKFDYVFTTGGIGPTHDDITSASVAKAFGVTLERHPEALKLLEKHYDPKDLNEARLKMADIPQGGKLIMNPVSSAPGFHIENVFVMAGVPSIMQAMFDNVKHLIKGGTPMLSYAIAVALPEGSIAKGLTELQHRYPESEMGSYPFVKHGMLGTTLVIRTTDSALLKKSASEIKTLLVGMGGQILEEMES